MLISLMMHTVPAAVRVVQLQDDGRSSGHRGEDRRACVVDQDGRRHGSPQQGGVPQDPRASTTTAIP